MIRNGDREKAGILVGYMNETYIAIRLESGEPQPFPVKQIYRSARAIRGPTGENAV